MLWFPCSKHLKTWTEVVPQILSVYHINLRMVCLFYVYNLQISDHKSVIKCDVCSVHFLKTIKAVITEVPLDNSSCDNTLQVVCNSLFIIFLPATKRIATLCIIVSGNFKGKLHFLPLGLLQMLKINNCYIRKDVCRKIASQDCSVWKMWFFNLVA